MSGGIGYYVHHHGDGHRQRALAIARSAPLAQITLIGTGLAGRTEGLACLDLPDDRLAEGLGFDGHDHMGDRPRALHYAPVHHDGIRKRAARLTDWIERERPALLVVDVSVEIAMLARLAATPTIYFRLGGLRDDPAHLDAFRGARAVLAPFHRELDEPGMPDWVRSKTRYCSGLSVSARSVEPRRRDTILVVFGNGGAGGDGDALAAAARAAPSQQWRVIGPASRPKACPDNLSLLGWVQDAGSEIARAGLVVGAAGDGLVSAVIATGSRFICLPEPRPFDEQISKARRLAALGVAIVLESWPDASDWPGLIAAANDIDPDGAARLHDPDGARHAADFLIVIAREGKPRAST